jgi:hypothetical protein
LIFQGALGDGDCSSQEASIGLIERGHLFVSSGSFGHGLSGVMKRSSVRSPGYSASDISMVRSFASNEIRRQTKPGSTDDIEGW